MFKPSGGSSAKTPSIWSTASITTRPGRGRFFRLSFSESPIETGAEDAPSASTAWAQTNRSAADLENPSNVCGVQRVVLELRVECASEILICGRLEQTIG